jgi:phosphoribosylaminoimidazole-succinocarboxamide synthase
VAARVRRLGVDDARERLGDAVEAVVVGDQHAVRGLDRRHGGAVERGPEGRVVLDRGERVDQRGVEPRPAASAGDPERAGAAVVLPEDLHRLREAEDPAGQRDRRAAQAGRPPSSVARRKCVGLLDGSTTWRGAMCARPARPPIPAGTAASLRRMPAAAADLPLIASGKVREMYALGDRILMVASDRISTYDVVHPNGIPGKGAVLTGLSAFWFAKTGHIVDNHFISATEGVPDDVRGRAMVVRRLEMLPVECVVRGYITGSGWKDYQATGKVSGIELAPGLRESERLPTPIFTPSTKAETGHDEAIDFDTAAELVGDRDLMTRVRDVSIALYEFAGEHARERGVILADTKFEFGLDETGRLVIGDEVLTPDSSRYWPADGYAPGRGQPSFDKQYVRDWASSSGWDKTPPAPELPEDVVAGTRERYVDAYQRITGESFDEWTARTAP